MKELASYTKKWLFYIVAFFLFFATILLISEYLHEKRFRLDTLNERMALYVKLTNSYIEKLGMAESADFSQLDTIFSFLPGPAIRLTIIQSDGTVVFDSQVKNIGGMENHLLRPEIRQSMDHDFGSDIRISGTTHIKYYYYAKRYDSYFVRVSAHYDQTIRKFVHPDRMLLMFMILVFLAGSLIIVLITDKYGKSILTLREFTERALDNLPIDNNLIFPENELGIIGQEIIEIYQNLNRTKEELISEKTKLIRHLNMLDEGIAIFSKESHVITSNNHFIRFINYISDTRVFTADEFFRIPDFNPLFNFINHHIQNENMDLTDSQPTYEITLVKSGRFFLIKCIVFQDKSFEISVNDISKPTKRKILKQQITENIAHELKTPVSSIRGFLETILEGNTDKERTNDYLRRAYSQSCRLADLIQDISILTKIEEAASLYKVEPVNLYDLITDIAGEIQPQLQANDMKLEINIPENLTINGNTGLLYSVFRNFFDNTLTYAGNGITIRLDNYMKDDEFYYFSFFDTGVGVPEADLPRLFERFYRVDKGRDRKKGGTGLGLAIVKNAIQFHKGEISVKNRAGGGLEFLFTLAGDVRISKE